MPKSKIYDFHNTSKMFKKPPREVYPLLVPVCFAGAIADR